MNDYDSSVGPSYFAFSWGTVVARLEQMASLAAVSYCAFYQYSLLEDAGDADGHAH